MSATHASLLSLLLPLLTQIEGWLGVYLAEGPAAVVAEVVPGSPAAAAGLQAGDVVLSLGGVAVVDGPALAAAVRGRAAGDRVAIVVRRHDREITLQVTLGERPGALIPAPAPARAGGQGTPGVPAAEPAPKRSAYLGLAVAEADGALRIEQVVPGGPASHAQVAVGDWLRSVAGRPVASLADLDRVMASVEPGQRVELGLVGAAGARSLLVEVGEAPGSPAGPASRSVAPTPGPAALIPAAGADAAAELAALRAELAALRAELAELKRELVRSRRAGGGRE